MPVIQRRQKRKAVHPILQRKPVYRARAPTPPPPDDEEEDCCCGPPPVCYPAPAYFYPVPFSPPVYCADFDRGWPGFRPMPIVHYVNMPMNGGFYYGC